MQIRVFPTVASVPSETFQGCSAVVIDVLRATTTIIQALSAGALAVVPVQSPDEAIHRAANLGASTVLGGERESLRIPGFHLSNSPEEYTTDAVAGKTVFFTTTNGTRGLQAAAEAEPVWVGALVNATGVARRLAATGRDAIILCAGSQGRLSLEDTVCAGAILMALGEQAHLDDLGLMALELFRCHRADLTALLRRGRNAQDLMRLGLGRDVHWAVRLDITDAVPVLRSGRVVMES